MKTKFLKLDKGPGYALLLTLIFLAAMLLVIAAMVNWSSTSAKITVRNNQFVASQLAAEAATEVVAAQMIHDFLSQGTNDASAWSAINVTNLNAWTNNITYQITDTNGTANRVSVAALPATTNIINNMMNIVQPYMLTATATPLGQLYNVPATVSQIIDLNQIPIFQYVIFYNLNLEIDPSADMPIGGNVHCNKSIWSITTHAIFSNIVEAAGQVILNPNTTDPFGGGYVCSASGVGASVFLMAGQPTSMVLPQIKLPVTGNYTNCNDESACYDILRWPTNSAYWPGQDAAYYPKDGPGQTYQVNKSDLIISNASFGINGICSAANLCPTQSFFVYYHDKDNTPRVTLMSNDFYFVTNINLQKSYFTNYLAPGTLGLKTNLLYSGYSFLTNVAFYDWREGGGTVGKRVEAIQFNVKNFNGWLDNIDTVFLGPTNVNGAKYYNSLCKQPTRKNHSIGGIYICDSVPLTNTVLPAVRMVNGQKLYDTFGLSVATPLPLYVQSDWNVLDASGSCVGQNSTAHAQPSAFYADAVTILSTNFSDSSGNNVSRAAIQTTINAACLAGIVPTPTNLPSGGLDGNGAGYSGGVENFLRFLENWGSSGDIKCYYDGSLVVVYRSQMATNVFRGSGTASPNYYYRPGRPWSFDTSFLIESNLPPMTPRVKAVVREGWVH
jgi:hypothetical protein